MMQTLSPGFAGPAMESAAGAPLSHPPFHFSSRRSKVDWRLLHGLDIHQVQARTDLDALERVIDVVAFGDLDGEDVRNLSEVNFLKIFRLAQMLVEYLLHVQEELRKEGEHHQLEHYRASKHVEALRLKCREQKEVLTITKRELKQSKRSLRTMEILAERGNENRNPNPEPTKPQVVYLDSPETLALVQKLQEELEKMSEQRLHMQSTIGNLTRQLEEIDDGAMQMHNIVDDFQASVQGSPGGMGGSPRYYHPPSVERSQATPSAAAAVRDLRDQNNDLKDQVDDLRDHVKALEDQLAEASAAATVAAPPAVVSNIGAQSELARLERKTQHLQKERDSAQEELKKAMDDKALLEEDVKDLQDELVKAQQLLASQTGSTPPRPSGLGEMEDDVHHKLEEDKQQLQHQLADALTALEEAKQENLMAREGGTDVRRQNLQIGRLEGERDAAQQEAEHLKDEVQKFKRLAERGQSTVPGDDRLIAEKLQRELENIKREYAQTSDDLAVARESADRLQAELEEGQQEVKRLKGLLEQYGVNYEEDLQHAAAEGRRVKHQTEHFEKVGGVTPGGDSVRTPGPDSARKPPLPTGTPPSPKIPVHQDEVSDEIEDFSDSGADSPMASLQAPVPVRRQVLGGSDSAPDLHREQEERPAPSLFGRSASMTETASAKVTPQLARRASSGWDRVEPSSPESTAKPQPGESEPEEDEIEDFQEEDQAPLASEPFGGAFGSAESRKTPEGSVKSAKSEKSQAAVKEFIQSDSETEEEDELQPVAQGSEPSRPESLHAGRDSPRSEPRAPRLPLPAPGSAVSRDTSVISGLSRDTPRVIIIPKVPRGPQDAVPDDADGDEFNADEERRILDSDITKDYNSTTADIQRWEDSRADFEDIYQFQVMEPSMEGRRSSALFQASELREARKKFGRPLERELTQEMQSYGVDPTQTFMSDRQFAEVMMQLDDRRTDIDQKCDAKMLQHVKFMRDTIRNHLMEVASRHQDGGAALQEADPPTSADQGRGGVNDSIDDDDISEVSMDSAEDEDSRTLGRFAKNGKSSPGQSSDEDSAPSNPSARSRPQARGYRPSPLGQPAVSATDARDSDSDKSDSAGDIEVLSSFDASEGSPVARTETASKDRGPQWHRSHDDPFDISTSIESAGGGAWGAGGSSRPPVRRDDSLGSLSDSEEIPSAAGAQPDRPRPPVRPAHEAYADSFSDDDISIEELALP